MSCAPPNANAVLVPGGSLDGGGWTSGCGSRGSPLVQCSSLTLDIGSGDSSLGVQCDGWLSAEASQGMHTVPALPPALEQDCSPRTNQLVPTRSYGESHVLPGMFSTHCSFMCRPCRFCSCRSCEECCSWLI